VSDNEKNGENLDESPSEDSKSVGPEVLSEAEEGNALQDRLLRALAEAENARKRAEKAGIEGRQAGMAQLLSELAPALDNLDLALEALAGSHEIETSLIEGLEATRRAINDALLKAGVKILRPSIGEDPDPNVHEIIGTVPSTESNTGQIVSVAQSGYMVGPRLVRAARVIVSRESDAS
jgi:molecular chaperone GrpE